MAFNAPQKSDIRFILGWPDAVFTAHDELDGALEVGIDATTEARVIANTTAAKQALVDADAELALVGVDKVGSIRLSKARERKERLAAGRRCAKAVADDLGVCIRHDRFNEAPRASGSGGYAPWG